MALETHTFTNSTNLAAASFDTETDTLVVEFLSGASYEYLNVPAQIYRSLTMAGSAGDFFNRHIKGRFQYALT